MPIETRSYSIKITRLFNVYRDHLDILPRLVILVDFCLLNGVNDIETSGSSSEYAVQMSAHARQPVRITHECLLSSHGQGTVVMKNCEPFVFGPAFAMLSVYGLQTSAHEEISVTGTYLSCLSCGWNSSSNSWPQMDSPPVPSPSGSPVCSIWAG